MRWKLVAPIAVVLICGCAYEMSGEDSRSPQAVVINTDCTAQGLGIAFDVDGVNNPANHEYLTISSALLAANASTPGVLSPGDIVCVRYRSTPYVTKFAISGSGNANAHIRLRGIPDPATGALPVIDGNGATDVRGAGDTRSIADSDSAVVVVDGGNDPNPTVHAAEFIDIENLQIQGALLGNTFYHSDHSAHTYASKSFSLHLHSTSTVTVRNCYLTASGLAVDSNATNVDSLFESNLFDGLGTSVGTTGQSLSVTYTEGVGTKYRFNRFGSVCSLCTGPALKDRSVNLSVESNTFDTNAEWPIDLVETSDGLENAANGHPNGTGDPASFVRVFGNVIIKKAIDGAANNNRVIHVGGDFYKCNPPDYPAGQPCSPEPDRRLFHKAISFYDNTVILRDRGLTTQIIKITGSDVNGVTADVWNNVVYPNATPAPGKSFVILTADTNLGSVVGNLKNNWIQTNVSDKPATDPLGTTITINNSANVRGSSPSFVDFNASDYHIQATSAARDMASPLPTSVASVDAEYFNLPVDRQSKPRQTTLCDAADTGAFEYQNPETGVAVFQLPLHVTNYSMEAEHASGSENAGSFDHSWCPSSLSGYSGAGAMQAYPNSGAANSYASTVVPSLDFQLKFDATGTWYVWLRGYAPDTSSNSVSVGFDYATVSRGQGQAWTTGAWTWQRVQTIAGNLQISATAGVHTLNVWMQKDGFILDKVVLTQDVNFTPTGTGPAESDYAVFQSNLLGDVAVFAGHYTSSAIFRDFDGTQHGWRPLTVSGTPSLAMQALPDTGGLFQNQTFGEEGATTRGAEIDYKVTLPSPSFYNVYFWVQGVGVTNGRTVYLGVDGTPKTSVTLPTTLGWVVASVPVGMSSGTHILNVWVGEDGAAINEIALSPSASTHNTAESAVVKVSL